MEELQKLNGLPFKVQLCHNLSPTPITVLLKVVPFMFLSVAYTL